MIETPKRYSNFLREFGGLNPHGEPVFILIWAGEPVSNVAIPEKFFGPYLRSWVLCEWAPPEDWGSPSTWDEELMQMAFPNRGLYWPLVMFKTKDGESPADLDSDTLNPNILAAWMWTSMNHKRDSIAKRRAVMDEEKAKRDEAKLKQLADRLQDAFPAFGYADAISGPGSPGATSAVRKRMEQIERVMPHVRDFAKRFPKKHSVTDTLPSRIITG